MLQPVSQHRRLVQGKGTGASWLDEVLDLAPEATFYKRKGEITVDFLSHKASAGNQRPSYPH